MRCRPSWQPVLVALALSHWLAACAPRIEIARPARGLHVVTEPAPSRDERYCAWYGTRDGDVLYFGESPFWSALRASGGNPRADLAHEGPQRVGRFDLRNEVMLPPIEVGPPGSRSGTWDVLAQGGRLYYTTFFEQSGFVELATGAVHRLPQLGPALNELAPGSQGQVVITRYGSGRETGNGSVLWIDRDGVLLSEHVLSAPAGYTVAPKTPAWDPRGSLWLTTDLLALDPREPTRRDAYRLDAEGRLLARVEDEELQFAATGPDGALQMAWRRDRELSLRVGGEDAPRRVLDRDFPSEHDFVQDIQFAPEGRVVLTRWSGVVHVAGPGGDTLRIELPRLDPDGLYYTGVLQGERLCATYCADVSVVCVDAPPAGRAR